jgi:hypothetical protein
MSNFSGRGYITLSDLDTLANDVEQIKTTLGTTRGDINSINGQTKDLIFYRNDKSNVSDAAVSITKSGIEAIAAKADVKDQGSITVDFKQDWKYPPVVTATIDGSNDQYACQIDYVTNKKVRIRFMKIKTVTKPTGASYDTIKAEAVNIIAVGITSN